MQCTFGVRYPQHLPLPTVSFALAMCAMSTHSTASRFGHFQQEMFSWVQNVAQALASENFDRALKWMFRKSDDVVHVHVTCLNAGNNYAENYFPPSVYMFNVACEGDRVALHLHDASPQNIPFVAMMLRAGRGCITSLAVDDAEGASWSADADRSSVGVSINEIEALASVSLKLSSAGMKWWCSALSEHARPSLTVMHCEWKPAINMGEWTRPFPRHLRQVRMRHCKLCELGGLLNALSESCPDLQSLDVQHFRRKGRAYNDHYC